MSEELGYVHAAGGMPQEPKTPPVAPEPPPKDNQPVPLQVSPSSIGSAAAAQQSLLAATSQISPTPTGAAPSFSTASAESAGGKRKFVPGGGSQLAKGDQPGDPFAWLVILAADLIVGTSPNKNSLKGPSGGVPASLEAALRKVNDLVTKAPRSVVVVAGGEVTTALMTQLVM